MQPQTETWYCWKEFKIVGDETEPRLITPWSEPYKYESPFDYLCRTPEDARELKDNLAPEEEDWILCKIIITPDMIIPLDAANKS